MKKGGARLVGLGVWMLLTPLGLTLSRLGSRHEPGGALQIAGFVLAELGYAGAAVFLLAWAATTPSRAWRWVCIAVGALAASMVVFPLGALARSLLAR
jgi:hypothetical protein